MSCIAPIRGVNLMKNILILLLCFYSFSFASDNGTVDLANTNSTKCYSASTTYLGRCFEDLSWYTWYRTNVPGHCTVVGHTSVGSNIWECYVPIEIPCPPPPSLKCDFGYSNDNTPAKTCVPDKECPPTMKYFAQETGTFSFDIKTCVPNKDISPEDCSSNGGFYASPETPFDSSKGILGQTVSAKVVAARGSGCYDSAYVQEAGIENEINNALAFGVAKIDKDFLAQLGKTAFTTGKTIADFVVDFFKTNPTATKQGLLEYKPNFVDVQIQPDGTYAVMDWQLRNQIWEDLGNGNVVSKLQTIDTPDIVPNNVYLGGDISTFSSNIIGTKSFLDDIKPFEVSATTPVNGVVNATIDLKNSLYGAEKTSFPTTSTLLEKQVDNVGTLKTVVQTKINFPDGSYTTVKTFSSSSTTGSKTFDVTVQTPIQTNSGLKIYEQGTSITKNSTGEITNSVSKPATVSFVTDSGQVVTSPNTSGVNAPIPYPENSSPINLSNVQASLNNINKNLSEIKASFQDAVSHVPTNTLDFNTKISNFQTGLVDFTISVENGFKFVNGLKDSFLDLEKQFQDAKNIFDVKPTLTLQNGTCPFQARWYGQNVIVDPCMFIAPYRPINAIFFTLICSFAVLIFALKYLFDVKLGGK